MSVKLNVVSSLQRSLCFRHYSASHQKSHYDVLGLTPKASQADIKSAFYRLSKIHHPDTNLNDSSAAEKFREVLDAYEVLSNRKARAHYDQGSGKVDTNISTTRKGFKAAEDPQAAFYRSRLTRRMSSRPETLKYDYDSWTQSHYSDCFRRGVSERNEKYQSTQSRNMNPTITKKANTGFSFISLIVVTCGLCALGFLTNQDKPRRS